jgi:lambda family phage tail tape measure protein
MASGKAGSLLIDIAANTAQLKKDFDSAAEEVSKFSRIIEGIGEAFKAAFAAGAVAAMVGQFKGMIETTTALAVAADKLATQFKLSTDQAQALSLVAERTGQSVAALAGYGEKNVDWLNRVTAAAKDAGLVIDGDLVKGLTNAANRTADLESRSKATFGAIAEAAKRTAVYIAEVFASAFGGGQSVERLEAAIGYARGAVANLEGQRVGVVPEVLNRKRAELAQMEADLEKATAWRRALEQTRTLDLPDPKTRTGGGGGARAKPDYFENTLKGLQDQSKAVTEATTGLTASTGLATKEAERLAQLQIDIAKDTATAVKAAHATTPEAVNQLKQAVTDLDTAKFKFNDLKTVLQVADQVQGTFGDGSKALADRIEYLTKALDLGTISQDEYNKAVTAATEAQAIQAEQSKGLQGGFEGIAAGWNKAALAASGAGVEMKIGEQAFTQTFSLMSNSISEFVTTGQVDFGKLAASFATMLANMAIQWAAAAFLKDVLGVGGLGGGGVQFGPPAPAVSGGMMATGGAVFPNRAYTVGENGPERFIPSVPGNIAADSKSTGDVTVHVAMGGGQGGSDPTKTVEFARRIKAAVVDTISGEKRPGGILYTRQSA